MNRLKELREKARLSQKELALKIGSHQPRVADFEKQPEERGYRRIPLDKAKKAAEVLDCTLSEIRPDVLSTDSFDLLLEGTSKTFKNDVRDYIIFKQKQQS